MQQHIQGGNNVCKRYVMNAAKIQEGNHAFMCFVMYAAKQQGPNQELNTTCVNVSTKSLDVHFAKDT